MGFLMMVRGLYSIAEVRRLRKYQVYADALIIFILRSTNWDRPAGQYLPREQK
jgi:hypothetical protein